MTKVLMFPSPSDVSPSTPSGIQVVVSKYGEHFHEQGIEIVNRSAESFDLIAIHAGVAQPPENGPFVSHCHGLYWTSDYDAEEWEYYGNAEVVRNLRLADRVTVPSQWVADNISRDMRFRPAVVPHGVDLDDWWNEPSDIEYVLWNKNRPSDVCSPRSVRELSERSPQTLFITTFLDGPPTPNIAVTGTINHDHMAAIVRSCSVYLATTKETFGIGTLEAMASGKPILGFDYGGTASLVKHGVNGYLARPGDYDDLFEGLNYCMEHRDTLGANSRYMASMYSWSASVAQVATVYREAIRSFSEPHEVSVVIPCYNKADTLLRAAASVASQKKKPLWVIIVNNNSTDDFARAADEADAVLHEAGIHCVVINEEKQGVAHARNTGIRHSETRYVCCLDADDEMQPDFLAVCVEALSKSNDIGVAYTKLEAVLPDGTSTVSEWPDRYNYDEFLRRKNQVPTCAVFRKEAWRRLGGYRQRYAPEGAGSEDAEFWLRMGSIGYRGVLASTRPLFRYHLGGLVSGNPNYRETDWLIWHPWVSDEAHPLASVASPGAPSHAVRQYDIPWISVIIPCSLNHLVYLEDALDSLEGQTFRKWEAIVVFDGDPGPIVGLRDAYPFVQFLEAPEGSGSGKARNIGVDSAKGDTILFLDADDWLEPACLTTLYSVYGDNEGDIIYSDYYGRAYGVENPEIYERANRLVHYETKDKFAIIRYSASDYDCGLAVRQPEMDQNGEFYIWNLISSLLPKSLHYRIGGFDETMESWEDWDYWLRMARAGVCFTRVQSPLVSYRFYSGTRREIGRQLAGKLLDYLSGKYRGTTPEMCNCNKKRISPLPQQIQSFSDPMASMSNFSASNIVKVRLDEEGFGRPITVRDQETGQLHDYGFRKGGDQFLMMRKHAEMFPHKFTIIEASDEVVKRIQEVAPASPPPAPEVIEPVAVQEPVEPVEPEVEQPVKRRRGRPKTRSASRSSRS